MNSRKKLGLKMCSFENVADIIRIKVRIKFIFDPVNDFHSTKMDVIWTDDWYFEAKNSHESLKNFL